MTLESSILAPETGIPQVTVECATFNHAPFIRDALDGFLRQRTTFRFEVIVHDDASTDGTADIVREYANQNPGTFVPILQERNQWSQGIDSWRTHTFPRSRGRYVAFCEGDDFWIDPDKLQKQFDFLEANPGVGLVHTGVRTNGEIEQVFNPWAREFRKSGVRRGRLPELICGNYISTPTVMARKVALEEALAAAERFPFQDALIDYWYWLRLSWSWETAMLPEDTAFYRVHPGGLSRNAGFMNLAVVRILDFHMKRGLSRGDYRRSSNEVRQAIIRRFEQLIDDKQLDLGERLDVLRKLLSTVDAGEIPGFILGKLLRKGR